MAALTVKPDIVLRKITDLTPNMLQDQEIDALILDVDNTLARHNDATPAEGVELWIRSMNAHRVGMIILSNNHAPRVAPFAKQLELPFVAEGMKPLRKGFFLAQQKLGTPAHRIGVVGDQIFTDFWGARMAHMKSVFVFPLSPEEGLLFRVKRTLERPFLPPMPSENKRRSYEQRSQEGMRR